MCTFLGLKHKSTIWDGTPCTCPSNLVYMCGLRDHNYLDSFTFYSVFKIWASLAPGGGAGGWGLCRVIRVSLDEFRNVQR